MEDSEREEKETSRPFSVRIKIESLDRLEEIAKHDERSISWLVNKAIQEYIERRGHQSFESIR